MFGLNPDPTPVLVASIVATLILRQIIFATFHVYPGSGTCLVYIFGCMIIPGVLPFSGVVIGAWTIRQVVRWVNRRDDPRFVTPPAPDQDAPSEAN